jgi:hypothetical protein
MAGVNIRRLAAVDMYGTRGAKRHRRIIRAKLITGAVVMVAFGVWLAASSGRAVRFCIIGCGLDNALLAVRRPGALDAELVGVDIGRDLRSASSGCHGIPDSYSG